MRLDIRIPDGDPLAAILSEVPGGARGKVARAILSAALLPGGWARIVGDRLTVAGMENSPASSLASAQAQRATLGLLRQLGAFDDDA
ncbi:MAG: hypothetical protein M0Z36_10025 [Thermaerobacter sp.]|nr:hypothetical protein [Thermaerobacter sp.]